jgi:hypothetical protein
VEERPLRPDPARPALDRDRLLGVLVAAVAAWTLLVVPFRILGAGWVPPDDARRHVAKVISDKSWGDILVLRPEATVDPHPGWHAILAGFESAGVRTGPGLLKVSVLLLSLLFLLAPLALLRRPEAWLLALLVVAVFDPREVPRLFLGRPYLLTMTVLVGICLVLPRLREERAPRTVLAGVTAAIAASAWIHGNWYLWTLPLAAFALAGERRAAARLAACAAAGIALGAAATGRPVAFLVQTALHPLWALRGATPATSVTEFHPFDGVPLLVLAVAVLALARARAGLARAGAATRPLFVLAALGWLLGLHVWRFWMDWGAPALLAGLALELEAALASGTFASGRRRLAATGLAAAGLLLALTGDHGLRWSKNAANRLGSLDRAEMRSWLPEPGGIVYNSDPSVFYDLFYNHPRAPWRYQLGFEPGLMPPADLRIYRAIQRERGSDAAIRPWAERLRAEDRLIVTRASRRPPELEGLEWVSPQGALWIGRTRRASPAAGGGAPASPSERAPAEAEDEAPAE